MVAVAETSVPEDGEMAEVAESPEGAFEVADTLGQAIKREPLTGYDADAPLGASEIDTWLLNVNP